MEQSGLSASIHSGELKVTQSVSPLNNWHLKYPWKIKGSVNVKINIKEKNF